MRLNWVFVCSGMVVSCYGIQKKVALNQKAVQAATIITVKTKSDEQSSVRARDEDEETVMESSCRARWAQSQCCTGKQCTIL